MDTKGQERLSDGTIALKDESHQWRSRRPPTSSDPRLPLTPSACVRPPETVTAMIMNVYVLE